jgi:hypothetical protein
MTPELAWIFAVFRPSGKIEARFGQLPSPRAIARVSRSAPLAGELLAAQPGGAEMDRVLVEKPVAKTWRFIMAVPLRGDFNAARRLIA